MLGCLPGFFDRINGANDGCEYGPCQLNGDEICNGQDDDCNPATTVGALTPPANFCNPNGVCADTTAFCGSAGWECNYGSAFESPEVSW